MNNLTEPATIIEATLGDGGTEKKIPELAPSTKDWPSYTYILLFVLNSLILAVADSYLLLIPLVIIQSFFFVGMLELTHQSVHRNFVLNRNANEALGTFASTLIGFNLIAYRHFHLEHHRHTCDDKDPEGLLYADSPTTKWFFWGSPISHIWVALHINHLAKKFVPKKKKHEWHRRREIMAIIYSFLALLAFVSPQSFLAAYLVPFILFTYIDFFFSQAEHYGAPIRAVGEEVDVTEVTSDVTVPYYLSKLMLHRSLHSVHHVWPRTRWFDTPNRMNYLHQHNKKSAIPFQTFFKRWMKEGPRLWHK